MGSISFVEQRRQEQAVLAACVEQLSNRPLAAITFKSIASASGLPEHSAYRALNRLAHNREDLLRQCVLKLSAEVLELQEAAPRAGASVFGTIEAHVAHMAEVVRGSAYTTLFRLVVCNGAFHGWLHDIYESRVAATFCRRLEADVRAAGARSGVAVFFTAEAPRVVLRRLEWSFALPSLVPGGGPAVELSPDLIRDIAQEAFARSHAWGLGEAQSEDCVRSATAA